MSFSSWNLPNKRTKQSNGVATYDGANTVVDHHDVHATTTVHAFQKHQQVVHYPERMQLGKRKFQSESIEGAKIPKNSNEEVATTPLDDEAGLSLLFAASLLQQGELMSYTSATIDHVLKKPQASTVVDAATTTKFSGVYNKNEVERSTQSSQTIPATPKGSSGGTRQGINSEVTRAASSVSDIIEPTFHDGMFVIENILDILLPQLNIVCPNALLL
jgi:hypothetical protein